MFMIKLCVNLIILIKTIKKISHVAISLLKCLHDWYVSHNDTTVLVFNKTIDNILITVNMYLQYNHKVKRLITDKIKL